MKQGIYLKPGGYCLFPKKMQELKKYFQEPRKGVHVTKFDSGKLLMPPWGDSVTTCVVHRWAITGPTSFRLSFYKHVQGACYTRYNQHACPRTYPKLAIELSTGLPDVPKFSNNVIMYLSACGCPQPYTSLPPILPLPTLFRSTFSMMPLFSNKLTP